MPKKHFKQSILSVEFNSGNGIDFYSNFAKTTSFTGEFTSFTMFTILRIGNPWRMSLTDDKSLQSALDEIDKEKSIDKNIEDDVLS